MASNVTLDSLSNYTGIKTVWSQQSQSISGNTSVLRATITHYSTAYSYANNPSTLTLKADGQTKTVTVPKWNWSGANSRSLGYVDFTISHNSNGSKSASISHSWNIFTQSKSGTFSFDTIPRTSTFTIPSSFTMGSEFTVSISRASSSFTHWVILWDGSTYLYSSGNTIGTSDSVDVALSTLAGRSPNAMSRSFRVQVDTYNGSTWIGSTSKNITGNVPSTVKPTFDAVTVSENVSSVETLVGAYVQTKSKLNLEITGASGIYGSTIRSYSISGVGHSASSSSTTTGVLSVSGNQTVKGIVTDSRGQAYEKSIVVNILPYAPPTLSDLSFRRTLPDKTEAPLGDNVTVSANVKVQSLIVNGVEKNSIRYNVQSAQTGYSFADKANTTSTSLTENYSDVWSGYLVDYSYNFRVRAGDVFGFGGWSVGIVPTGIVTQQWGSKTTSFGKMIDDTSYNVQVGTGGVQSDGPIIDKAGNEVFGAVDYVIDGDTNAYGTWEKWSSGKLIQKGTVSFTTAIDGKWGQFGLYDAMIPRITYPTPFISTPVFKGDIYISASAMMVSKSGGASRTTGPIWYLVYPGTVASRSYTAWWEAKARWK